MLPFVVMIIPTKPVPFRGSILVTGATGTVGKLVVAELLRSGARVRAGVRSVSKAAPLKNMGAQVVELDYARQSTITLAFTGVDRLFIVTPLDNRMVQFTEQLVAEAQKVGVKHIVKLSAVGASIRSLLSLAKWHGEAEQIVANSGVPFTIIRPAMFMQNFVTMFGASIRDDDIIYAAAGEGKVPFIDARDIARVVAKVILEKHTDRIYTLTGSEVLSFSDVALILRKTLKREIEYAAVSQEGARSGMEGLKMPSWMVEAFLEMWSAVRAGHFSVLSSDYKTVTGLAPVLFCDFAVDYKEKWV